jgi:hypothetical protein
MSIALAPRMRAVRFVRPLAKHFQAYPHRPFHAPATVDFGQITSNVPEN